ncbi:baseplate [Staphylococcus phage SAP6]|nr:baseplate [Staphylococcus phage StAP1]WAW12183.1 baseplate [Staphylococcus phage SAP6]
MRTRKLTQILSRLMDKTIQGTSKITDFTPGSAVRSLLEAVALEIEQYYILTRENINWGIQEGIIEAFDFQKRKAKRSYGNVDIQFYQPLDMRMYIPAGTTFSSTRQEYPQQFETLVDYYAEEGTTEITVEVYCKEVGIVGNIPEDIINTIASGSSLIRKITNPTSFNTGTKEESQEDFKRRFHMFVESRGRATNKSIRYGTLQVPDVDGVYVYEEVGHVTVYAHDKNGNLSATLKNDIITALEDYRPSGIKLDVVGVEKEEIDVSAVVTISNKARIGDTLQRHIESVIRGYLNSLTTSDDLIINDLIQAIMNIDDNLIYDVTFKNLSTNIEVSSKGIIRAGDIKVELI